MQGNLTARKRVWQVMKSLKIDNEWHVGQFCKIVLQGEAGMRMPVFT
jgi:hypothetical protein